MKILYTFLILVITGVSATAQSQAIDTNTFKSAKDYIRYKEETDPNMNGRRSKKIIQLTPPVHIYTDSTPQKKIKKTQTTKRKP